LAQEDEQLGYTFLKGPQQLVMLRAIFPQAIFISNQRSVHANIKLYSQTLHSEVSALINNGATENFIISEVIKFFNILTFMLLKPQTICNIDGTKNCIAKVIEAANLNISYMGKCNMHIFYIINLGNDHMLLGMPFIAATNSCID
jgi:hypothetical protein